MNKHERPERKPIRMVSITEQVGRPIWQKSFYDHGIRNQQDYDEIWTYIENNPLKYVLKSAP